MAQCVDLAPWEMGIGLLLESIPLCDRHLAQKHCIHNLGSMLTASTWSDNCFLKVER